MFVLANFFNEITTLSSESRYAVLEGVRLYSDRIDDELARRWGVRCIVKYSFLQSEVLALPRVVKGVLTPEEHNVMEPDITLVARMVADCLTEAGNYLAELWGERREACAMN